MKYFFLTLGLIATGGSVLWGQALSSADLQKELQTRLILAEDGDVIELPAGTFSFTKSLSMDHKSNITLRGAGMGATILSFADQREGAEGLKITHGSNILLEDFTVEDSKGDAIKVQYVEGITFRRVKTAWTGRPKKSNGAYGFYPVQCSQVLIEDCEARGASDAGIYVGQSTQIVVRRCRAYENVAGIEIENSSYADVYENESYDNTGGILVFDMPNLTRYGSHCRIFNNKVHDNNLDNFAPKGNVVGSMPAGTGIILLATTACQVFDNEISRHRTAPVSIVSFYLMDEDIDEHGEDSYDPYPTNISIHRNIYDEQARNFPDIGNKLGFLLFLKFGRNVPEIVYDGIVDEKRAGEAMNYPGELALCISEGEGPRWAFLNLGEGTSAITYMSPDGFDCTKAPLAPAEVGSN